MKYSKEQRLKAYKKGIKLYFLSLIFPFLKKKFRTTHGMCYFLMYHMNSQNEFVLIDFPELEYWKPAKIDTVKNGRFWFKKGKCFNRLICMIQAYLLTI